MSQIIRILFAAILVAFLFMTATQWRIWQTGRVPQTPLELVSGGPEHAPPGRIWIDTDAACGAAARADPDDCFALLWLVLQRADIAGVSTSFGNASGDVVTERLAALSAKMLQDGLPVPPVFRGYGEPRDAGAVLPPDVTALRTALEAGPLTILALGPLTNIAAALEGRPDLYGNVSRIVAVMGHQPGHLFHPTEGGGTGAILGHGPIFRDLNFSSDPDAAGAVLVMNLPMTLIPYDAAKGTLITGPDLDLLASRSRSQAWIAKTSRDWLAFWNADIGLPGFYPFDWVAAAYLTHPKMFDCAKVTARIGREWTFWVVPRTSLLVQNSVPTRDDDAFPILYCPVASPRLHDLLFAP